MVSWALFSSRVSDWETPPDLFEALHREFRFTVDAAANERNHKLPLWYGPGSPLGIENALIVHWDGVAYLNPPYGPRVGIWVAKACEEAAAYNATVVCLLPARTDTSWWHGYVLTRASEIRFILGRIRFVGAKHPAPFPSCIVVFPIGGSARPPVVRSWSPQDPGIALVRGGAARVAAIAKEGNKG